MKTRALFFGLALLILAGGAMYFIATHFHQGSTLISRLNLDEGSSSGDLMQGLPRESTSSVSQREVPPGYKEYRSDRYWFSLLYPEDFETSLYEEGAGAGTITIQNVKTGEGLQIFVVPYSGNRITEERFHMDVPSGVRENDVHVTIDGAGAEAFYSKNAQLGDTAEIWFMSHGLLYEVTTLKPLDTWLSGVMATWKFI